MARSAKDYLVSAEAKMNLIRTGHAGHPVDFYYVIANCLLGLLSAKIEQQGEQVTDE